MLIKADEEAKKTIIDFCDMALKTGGLRNKSIVDKVLASIQDIEKEPEE